MREGPAGMEALVQAALLRHSTAYKGLEPGVLAELVDVAAKAGTDTGALAASFDRFMTINRYDAGAGTDPAGCEPVSCWGARSH